ncbi:PXDN [Mytilus edulis]|uniref:PXDN n=1 Tax=Mytilus edulis TaxID=6550 RepID=A0A8S3VDW0_MYTED|nr:PXDN [Mytilus edulis]
MCIGKKVRVVLLQFSSASVGVRGINQTHPSLILDSATSSDSGTYVCIASNIAGTQQSEEITFVVYGGESGTSGGTLSNPSLIIDFATLSDGGHYTCSGTNVAGTSNGPQIKLKVTGGKPIVTVDSSNETVEYGSNVTLHCNVISSPTHTEVYWQKSSNGTITSLFDGLPGVLGVTLENPSLTIEYITREDIGIYTCFAKIPKVGSSNDTIDIDLIAGAPKITVDKLNYTAHDGKSVQLLCSIHSNPQHNTVVWERNVTMEQLQRS